MDLVMNYDLLKALYEEAGEEKFFTAWEKAYPNFKLYRMSMDWLKSKEYILKFRGTNGDIVVRWE